MENLLLLGAAAAAGPLAVGGKAFALSRLLRQEVRVPPGFCVTADGMDRLDSDAMSEALVEALGRLGAQRVAVRSSAIGEDAPQHSYAGVFRSVLDVPSDPDSVRRALREVRASLSGASAETYRQAMGITAAGMAALVQPMMDRSCAGVMFTRDPLSGARQLVVEVSPDAAGSASVAYVVLEPSGEPANPDEVAALPAALPPLFGELARAARSCEAVLGEGLDIEWTSGDGMVWVLQARAISALG
ncbi:PEP/pyruvate-binding domain-containing protein [Micromonospora rubida]|uniref:PEP/pyruvate-binding domain-containing protein n=1 Tax=Micromonospora rubida TaxID=2697657 RepID=UPI00137710D9|nr:PEP/pyruvate-binding domain-containing protein [Micromonospora rubida]NBE79612.1 hypothetical protein [Micromonospora rubida]